AGGGGRAGRGRSGPGGRCRPARHSAPGRPLRVWEWRTARPVLELPDTRPYVFSLDFHPGGEEVAVGAQGRIDCYGLPGGARRRSLRMSFDPGWLAFEPERGERLAVCGGGADPQRRLEGPARGDGRARR